MRRRPEEPRWRVGERVQLQSHLDLTQMGVGVILDIEAKVDGVAKAALVRFEGGPRSGLWYSIGSLAQEDAAPRIQSVVPALAKRVARPAPEPEAFMDLDAEEVRPARVPAPPGLTLDGPGLYYALLGRLDAPRLYPLMQMETGTWPARLKAFLATPAGAEAGTLSVLLLARGANMHGLTAWLSAVWRHHPDRLQRVLAEIRRELEARPLWRWKEGAAWPKWLFRSPWQTSGVTPEDERLTQPRRFLDKRQLILRGWLFPGERMRALLGEFDQGVAGVESERAALDWAEARLRALGWWRPLEVRPLEPEFLARQALRDSLSEALPTSTQEQLESLLRGAQRAGIVRSPAEAAAWARAWIEVWVSRTESGPEARLPERLTSWDLIQRGWLFDPVRIRAILAKEERARARLEPKYLQSPLAWVHTQLEDLRWLRKRKPSVQPLDPGVLWSVSPAELTPELLEALRKARSAGIVRDVEELDSYAKAWLEKDRARRLQEALDRDDLGGALSVLGDL